MKKLIQELTEISEKIDKITASTIIIVDSVDFWTEKAEKIFKEIEDLEENDEYSPEEEKRIEEILFQIRSLVRRTDIEIENLAKLDEEHRALKKRQVKIYNLLKK